jgi:23S rRNA pseudouridine1911/1915/1917 synthase
MVEAREANPPDEFATTSQQADRRLDAVLAERFSQFSRAHLQRIIEAGGVEVDHRPARASQRLREGQQVRITWIEPPREGPQAEEIPLEILYEDEALVAINKPPGMVVHPAKGHWSGTLASALRHHFEHLSSLGGPTRPGIVHRLDRDTSGVIVVAKTDVAHARLSEQFAERSLDKEYFAVVCGTPDRDRDQIDGPIGQHPHQREKMAIARGADDSQPAVTFYEVRERFDGFAAVIARPKTGRTHQIRVHLASIGCPVLCDRLYGGRACLTLSDVRRQAVQPDEILLNRQALHAQRLSLSHPLTGQPLEFIAPLPEDICKVLEELRTYRRSSG